jgi:regulator-associated protein of mTOR
MSRYIPILLFDVLSWAGPNTCYVWDSQNAGRFIKAAYTEAAEIDSQLRGAATKHPNMSTLHPAIYHERQVHFAACGADETIVPVNGLPDDLFTACLLTPLRIALLNHNLRTLPLEAPGWPKLGPRSHLYMTQLLETMSENLQHRLQGELRAIVQTIAWQTMDGPTYLKLFGSSGDLVTNLAGGFVLAQRVLSGHRMNPESIPPIPMATWHPLWMTWDMILDTLFEQIPDHFDALDPADWERDLKLVPFMSDQLATSLENTRPSFATDVPALGRPSSRLSRLPIICQGIMSLEFRSQACQALDLCLRDLDMASLMHAIQGGALYIATQLLAMEDPALVPHTISIWSSLVHHQESVEALVDSGRSAAQDSSGDPINYFLDTMERFEAHGEEGLPTLCKAATVLATISDHVPKHLTSTFTTRTLSTALKMLQSGDNLKQQWGALLTGKVLGAVSASDDQAQVVDPALRKILQDMTLRRNIEDRAIGVYAMVNVVRLDQASVGTAKTAAIRTASTLGCRSSREGSALVRAQQVGMLSRGLELGGHTSCTAVWSRLSDFLPEELRSRVQTFFETRLLSRTPKGSEESERVVYLRHIVEALDLLRIDPDIRVALEAKDVLGRWYGTILPPLMSQQMLDRANSQDHPELAAYLLDPQRLTRWRTPSGPTNLLARPEIMSVFERTRLALNGRLKVSDRF